MSLNIGICGSHRTGKTTLANALAEKLGIHLAITSTSDVFKKHGLDPAQPLEFKTRLWIQQLIIEAGEQVWRQSTPFVTDRTPIDMLAYTLADIQGSTDVEFSALQHYAGTCFRITRQYFSSLVVVQPAIPLIYEVGKAALNQAYIEHLNNLIIGLCYDERLTIQPIVIKREILSLEERINLTLQALSRE